MYPELIKSISTLSSEIDLGRKNILDNFSNYISEELTKKGAVNLNFICTHNSRRSHLAQIWCQTAAAFYKIQGVNAYSGGTEATAMFLKVKETLINQGFQIQKLSENDNPIYAIKHSEDWPAIIAFSKKYDISFNPQSNFSAVMTCDHADKNCPLILGATKRFSIQYEDPKKFDDTPQQSEKYLERSLQIASEMFYTFKNVQQKNG